MVKKQACECAVLKIRKQQYDKVQAKENVLYPKNILQYKNKDGMSLREYFDLGIESKPTQI